MKLFFNFSLMLTIVLFGFSCSSFRESDYVKIADSITNKTAKKLKERKNLFLVGTGGEMMHDIQKMDMSFDYYQEVDLKTARELMVYVINEYLSAINNSAEVRPYLHEYPFTAKNVEIRIFIYKPDRTDPPLDKICCFSAINGILEYFLDLPKTYSLHCICEETFEDALKIVDSKK